jgi:CheY-like chemotaxis protein
MPNTGPTPPLIDLLPEPPGALVGSARAPASSSSPSILIVDDDDELRDALADLLGGLYQLTFARDGAEAMAALCRKEFDLSILDLSLPVVGGFGLAKAIQSSSGLPPSAVMMLSGHAAPELKVRALALGAADYVTKPFDPDDLMTRVARILAAASSNAPRSRRGRGPGEGASTRRID